MNVAEMRIRRKNLEACVAAARRSLFDQDPGPDDPADLAAIVRTLDDLGSFPGIYRELALTPLRQSLERLGQEGLAAILAKRQGDLLILDLAQALSQRHGSYHRHELMAFQEVVSDLFDGFLSAEDRRGLKPPDRPVPAPLVKWGRPDLGPYALGADQMMVLGVRCGIVSLPGAVARADGLFSWGVLPHETSGHGILACERGLLGEMAQQVAGRLRRKLVEEGVPEELQEVLIDHWVFTLEDAAADVLGVLNMGPAAAIASLILLLASVGSDRRSSAALRESELLERHPVPVLRIALMASTLGEAGFGRIADFSGRGAEVAKLLLSEAEELADGKPVVIAGQAVPWAAAVLSAQSVAHTIVNARLPSLANASLRAIQTWRDRDECIVGWLRAALASEEGTAVDELLGGDFYAAHVVAAAILEALTDPDEIPRLHRDMVLLLAVMHDANPGWGPLGQLYASDLTPRRAGGIPRPHGTRSGGIPRLHGTRSGGIPRPHGTGSGGIPPMFARLVVARGDTGTGGIPRPFALQLMVHQSMATGSMPDIPDTLGTRLTTRSSAVSRAAAFPYPLERRKGPRSPET